MTSDKKMRALFISPYTFQSRSLQTHIENSGNLEIDLMINKKISGPDPNVDYVNHNYRNNITRFFQFYLPIDECYRGKNETLLYWFSAKLKKALYFFNRRKIKNCIHDGNYDFIYLNSLVLHPLIARDHCFIIHIREIFDNSSSPAAVSIQKAQGVIFIDEATERPFVGIPLKNKITLNNPFQMKRQIDSGGYPLRRDIDWRNKVVFSIIGRVEEIKGVSLAIKAFKDVPGDHCVLLVVGDGEGQYVSYCKELAGSDSRIVFYGNEENIQIIYDISDYIIRGDPQPCIGRTIYEGLFSGCDVIIPGSGSEMLYEYDRFKTKIHFYTANDQNALTNQILKHSTKKILQRVYLSNVDNYLTEFHGFITRICKDVSE